MDIFLDTADISEIKELASTGLIDGVTTNPTLIAKEGKSFIDTIKAICDIVGGPVSAEVTSNEAAGMIKEGQHLAKIAPNVVVKVPLSMDGLKACKALSDEGIPVNVTLCFSPTQALLAAKAGARFISPFLGRLDDISASGVRLIEEIQTIYSNYPQYDTLILAASIRHAQHVADVARLGADVATLPPSVFRQLYNHPLTEKGIKTFLEDWAKTGQSILV